MSGGAEGDEEGSQSSWYLGHVDCEVPQGLVCTSGWTLESFILSHTSTGCMGQKPGGWGSGHAELCNTDRTHLPVSCSLPHILDEI